MPAGPAPRSRSPTQHPPARVGRLLGRGPGRPVDLHRRGRGGQQRLSRLPRGVLPGIQPPAGPGGASGITAPCRDPTHPHEQGADRRGGDSARGPTPSHLVLLHGAGRRVRPLRVLHPAPQGVPGSRGARPDPVRIMRLEEFDYRLPPDRVAQVPAARRDASRLLVLDRSAPGVEERPFASIGDCLAAGDLLVLNDTRVIPARLRCRKPTGGLVELLLVTREAGDPEGGAWSCMASTTRGLKPGSRLGIAPGFDAEFLGEAGGGLVRVRLHAEEGDVGRAIERHGSIPLPPYIRRDEADERDALDRERYQTVYARADGAIAAPTAGLHFTAELLEGLRARGIDTATLTLHVGPGTFQPVRALRVEEHRLLPEAFRLTEETAAAVAACRARGGRVVAVGTTVVRVLEEQARDDGGVEPGEGWCGTYIIPGHRFRAVDALLTNLHLPRTSLLILVAAFAGRERILAAYEEA